MGLTGFFGRHAKTISHFADIGSRVTRKFGEIGRNVSDGLNAFDEATGLISAIPVVGKPALKVAQAIPKALEISSRAFGAVKTAADVYDNIHNRLPPGHVNDNNGYSVDGYSGYR